MSNLIGPLTAEEEWCSLCLTGDDDDILMCCGNTSDARDLLFSYLRMGGNDHNWDSMLKEALDMLKDHGFPQDQDQEIDPIIVKIAAWCGYTLSNDTDNIQ